MLLSLLSSIPLFNTAMAFPSRATVQHVVTFTTYSDACCSFTRCKRTRDGTHERHQVRHERTQDTVSDVIDCRQAVTQQQNCLHYNNNDSHRINVTCRNITVAYIARTKYSCLYCFRYPALPSRCSVICSACLFTRASITK